MASKELRLKGYHPGQSPARRGDDFMVVSRGPSHLPFIQSVSVDKLFPSLINHYIQATCFALDSAGAGARRASPHLLPCTSLSSDGNACGNTLFPLTTETPALSLLCPLTHFAG